MEGPNRLHAETRRPRSDAGPFLFDQKKSVLVAEKSASGQVQVVSNLGREASNERASITRSIGRTKMRTRSLLNLAVVSIAVSATATAVAASPDLSRRAAFAVDGHEQKFVKVNGHEFHIKPPTVQHTSVSGVRLATIDGQISHHLNWRKDDQYYYCVVVTDRGTLVQFSERIERGGFTPLLARAVAESGIPLAASSESLVKQIGQATGKRIDGDWQGAARVIAAAVAQVVVRQLPRTRPSASRTIVLRSPTNCSNQG